MTYIVGLHSWPILEGVDLKRKAKRTSLTKSLTYQRSVIIGFCGVKVNEEEDVGPHVVFLFDVMYETLER